MNRQRLRGRVRQGIRQVRRWASALLAEYVPQLVNRLPTVTIATGWWLPGWVVRLTAGLIATACVLLEHVAAGWWVVLAPLIVGMILWPGGSVPGATVVGIGFLHLVSQRPPSALGTALLLLALPGMAQLATVAAQASPRAKIELTALLVVVPPFAAIQALVQPLALIGAWLTGLGVEQPLVPVLALLAAAGLVYWWLPRLERDP